MTVPTWRRLLLACNLGVALFVLPAGCGADGRYVVIGTPTAPNASGTVEVDALDGGGTQVSVHLEFLPAPSRLADELTCYVLWFLPAHGAAVFGGALKYNADQRSGDLQATSPFRHFTVSISAERECHPAAPSENVVTTQEVKLE